MPTRADSATGEQTGDIWQRSTRGSGGWSRLDLSDYTPGKVLAATYSYRDDHLWILDEVREGTHLPMARLMRVHAGTGVRPPPAARRARRARHRPRGRQVGAASQQQVCGALAAAQRFAVDLEHA